MYAHRLAPEPGPVEARIRALVADHLGVSVEDVEPNVSLVVRLDGTNAEEGRRILAEANHPKIVPADTMLEGAKLAATLTREAA